jgi:hypothetical protein
MKKQHSHEELSNVRCACGKRIKARVVEQKENTKNLKCYNCWIEDEAKVSGKSGVFVAKAKRETRHAEETRV